MASAGGKNLELHRDGFGNIRPLGRLLPKPGTVESVPMFGDQNTIPRTEWHKYQKDVKIPEIPMKDQDGKGACNFFATSTVCEVGRWIGGAPFVELSPWFGYAIACNGIDRGSNILEALDHMMKTGLPQNDKVPYGTINPNRLSKESYTDAARFRIEIGNRGANWDQIVTKVIRDEPMDGSVCVGGSFNDLDKNGVVGFTNGYGNHAVAFWGGLKEIGGGNFAIRFQNSWTKQWGDDGFGWVTEKHVMQQQFMEFYGILAMITDPQDPTKMPSIG